MLPRNLIPRMVETIAAYLGILDILVRLAKYGDRRVRRGVLSAVQAMDMANADGALNDVRALFHDALKQRVGTDRALVIERAVHVIEEVATTSQLAGAFNNDQHELIPYGTVLFRVIQAVGSFLNRSRVFEAWNQDEWTDILGRGEYEQEVAYSVIAFPYTWHLLQFTRPQAKPSHQPGFRPAHLCLLRRVGKNKTIYDLTAWQALADNGTERVKERYRHLWFNAYTIDFQSYITAPRAKPLKDIDFALFEALLLGMLLDVVAYDRQIINEIQKSKVLISKLMGLRNTQIVLPF